MFGTVILGAVGALSFKLGMDAQHMKNSGKSTGEIVVALPGCALAAVTNTIKSTVLTVSECYTQVKDTIKSKKAKTEKKKEKDSDFVE